MTDRKEQKELSKKILEFLKANSVKGNLSLTTPEITQGLGVDRRKIEPLLLLLSSEGKKEQPELVEITKGRVKYYSLKEIVNFCQKWVEGE